MEGKGSGLNFVSAEMQGSPADSQVGEKRCRMPLFIILTLEMEIPSSPFSMVMEVQIVPLRL